MQKNLLIILSVGFCFLISQNNIKQTSIKSVIGYTDFIDLGNSIRPFLNEDGGDISLVEVTQDMVVKVELTGACSSCNVSMMTLKNGVEVAVKNAVPEVKEVIDVTTS